VKAEALKIGMWVKGRTDNDELFQGYIESLDPKTQSVIVRVIHSDHARLAGQVVQTPAGRVQAVEESPLDAEGHLLNFIDIALTTRDKQWFMELTSILKELRQSREDGESEAGNASGGRQVSPFSQ
jgi:hypothetical protein